MTFSKIKDKYFILVEGSDRAIIRASEDQAERIRSRLLKHSRGKRCSFIRLMGEMGETRTTYKVSVQTLQLVHGAMVQEDDKNGEN